MLLMIGLLPKPGLAGAATEHIPEITGKTTVTFDGTSGIRLRVPQDVTLTSNDIELTLEGSDAAMGQLAPLDHPCKAGFENDDSNPQWCGDYSFRMLEGWRSSPMVFAPGLTTLEAGRIDLYMVTKGVATVTLTVPELEGTVSYKATGELDGTIVKHPVACPTQNVTGCEHQGWGGQVFTDVKPPARVGSVSFVQRPNKLSGPDVPTPGSIAIGSCIYPSFYNPEKTADPEDHPRGCDPDESGSLTFQNVYVTGTVNPLNIADAHFRAELAKTSGPFYTGFAAHQLESAEELEGPGRYGSYGYWYSREIRCSSGDWTDCEE
ncbi:MAG: hypothetical protein ACRDH9_11155 [Actinomycetota bacterium]